MALFYTRGENMADFFKKKKEDLYATKIKELELENKELEERLNNENSEEKYLEQLMLKNKILKSRLGGR